MIINMMCSKNELFTIATISINQKPINTIIKIEHHLLFF